MQRRTASPDTLCFEVECLLGLARRLLEDAQLGGAGYRPSPRVNYGAGTSPKRDRNSCADGVSSR
jgi:hypothetical protein